MTSWPTSISHGEDVRQKIATSHLLDRAALACAHASHVTASWLLSIPAVSSHPGIEVLRFLSDILAWLACTCFCVILARVAWKLRGRIPFILSGGMLAGIVVGVGFKRTLDLLEMHKALQTVDHRVFNLSSVITIVVSVAVFVLMPFLRKVVEFGLTADEERQRFLTAADTSLHSFCILNVLRSPFRGITDFRIAFANAVAETQLGAGAGRLEGMALSEVMPNMHESGVFRRLKYVAQTGIPYHGRVREKNSSGKELLFNLRAVKTDEGVAVVMHDLSEEQQRERRLEQMNRFSQSIIEDAPFSIIAINESGIITAVNAATQILTQYRRDELVGKHSIVMLHEPGELSSRSVALGNELGHPVAAGFETLIASLANRQNSESEWTYVRKDGRKVSVHLAMTALRDPEDNITGYLAIAFDISERKALTDSINFMAMHDSLTKLPNRAMLNTRLHEAIERAGALSRRVALFVIDIDHFKRINDSLGHTAGDDLLIAAGERLKGAVRTTDTVARTGGDEFIVMMPNAGEVEDIMRSGDRLLNALRPPLQLAGCELNITSSIGICIYPDLAADSVSLIRNADAAMYAAKRHGRNCIHAFSEKMLEANADRLEMEADLRRAVERQELMLYYQPQVNTRTHEVTGVEALLRWSHPSRGMVPPSEFIQAAEDSGLIVPIGEWVIRTACTEARRMQNEIGRRFTIALNLSPRQVLQENLVEIVENALASSGLAPNDLELEITENTLMISSPETLAMLARIRELGVHLAVDDFGTGFSSFKYILEYKVDRLKIDQSFIQKCASDATAAAIVRTVIAMAHGLNMTVVAEGVESEDQLAFLVRRRCDEAQGYRFGRPVPMADLRCLLAGRGQAMNDGRAFVVETTAAEQTAQISSATDKAMIVR